MQQQRRFTVGVAGEGKKIRLPSGLSRKPVSWGVRVGKSMVTFVIPSWQAIVRL
jgi:hypothetical protein